VGNIEEGVVPLMCRRSHRRRGAETYPSRMSYLSDWHACDPSDRSTFPKVSARVQIRYKNGSQSEGNREDFFPRTGLLPGSLINGWRYIRDKEL
jgi:hypothetical protein